VMNGIRALRRCFRRPSKQAVIRLIEAILKG
jgi:hypothetical protein